jgi:hypothetical protein
MSNSIHAILSQFPGPVRLRSSRRKWFGILIGSILFVVLAVALMHMPAEAQAYASWVAIPSVVFFGAGVLVSAAMLLPGAGALTLNRDGFAIQSLFRNYRYSWQQVSEFGVVDIGTSLGHPTSRRSERAEMVAFDDAKATGKLADWSRKMIGRSGALPETYGLDCQALASLLNAWRTRAIGGWLSMETQLPAAHQRSRGPWG